MDSLIRFIPIKRIPRPARIWPISWAFFCALMNRTMATPAKANSGAIAPTSSAINCPVMVVPMLAPMIIQTACLSVIIPELTNPTTITVVAEDD